MFITVIAIFSVLFLFMYVFKNFVSFMTAQFYGSSIVLKYQYLKLFLLLYEFEFTIYWFGHTTACNFMREFNNLFYLSMLIDSGTWQAKARVLYALKLSIKCKLEIREFLFLQYPGYFSLMLFHWSKNS